jgi:uncharacterized membrane protein
MLLYHVNLTLHVLAALLWLGGMFFLAAVGAPVLRRLESPQLRARLFRDLGLAFRGVGWPAIGILVVTGIANLHFRGVLRTDVLASADFWSTGFGTALGWKLASVTAMIVTSALHDFWIGPRASGARADAPGADRRRRWASWLARANAALGVIVVVAAVRLSMGG